MIPYADVMRLMNKTDHKGDAVPFSMKVVRLDRNRNSGGDLLVIDKAVISRKKATNPSVTPSKVSPKHYENSTRNIQLIPSGEIRSIHPRLIIEFNNKPMFY